MIEQLGSEISYNRADNGEGEESSASAEALTDRVGADADLLATGPNDGP